MKLIQCRFSSGQRVPLLVQDGLAAPLPKLVPFIYIINARPDRSRYRSRYRSLTDTQLQIIHTLIRPGAAENPFPERLQLRNWLMIELLLETGIRRGELLKLYTTDINQGSQHAYVSINDREHDPGDPRAEAPALKTHGRTVGLSAQVYEVYER